MLMAPPTRSSDRSGGPPNTEEFNEFELIFIEFGGKVRVF